MEGVPNEPRLFWYKGWADITKGPLVEEQMLELYRTSHLASSMVVSENGGPFVTLGELMVRRGVINPFLPDFIVGGRPDRETSMSGEKVDLLAEKIDFLYLSVRRLTEELHTRAPAQIDDDVFNQPALFLTGDTNQSSEEAPSPQSADSSAISGWHNSAADMAPENFQTASIGSSPDVWPAGLISPTALLLDRFEWDFTRAGGFAFNIGPHVTSQMPIGGQMAPHASVAVDKGQSVSSSDDWMVVGQELKEKKRRYSERRSAHPLPLLKTCSNREHQPADENRLAELSRTWRKVVSDKREVIYSRAVAEAFQSYLQDIECPSCPHSNLKKNTINFLGHLLSRNHLKQLDSVCAPDVEFWIHFLTNRRSAQK